MEEKSYEIVWAPFDKGGIPNSETRNAPEAIRKSGILQEAAKLNIKVKDGGILNEESPKQLSSDASSNEGQRLNNLNAVTSYCSLLANRLYKSWNSDSVPIVVGGDHSISIASVGVASFFMRSRGKDLGLVWVDAHADINTPETTPSGNIHGMPVAVLLGLGAKELCSFNTNITAKIKPENICYIGLRDVDEGEKELIKKLGIKAFTMKEIDERGIGEVCHEAYEFVTQNTGGFYISFDMDVCDPIHAPGVGTPIRGGLTYREAHLVLELAAEHKDFISFELVEYDPSRDLNCLSLSLAKDLILSGMGKTIL